MTLKDNVTEGSSVATPTPISLLSSDIQYERQNSLSSSQETQLLRDLQNIDSSE